MTLGCGGNGRMVITAVKKFGAKKGVGVDLNPVRVTESKENAEKARVEKKVEFLRGQRPPRLKICPDATVVLLYMGRVHQHASAASILKDKLKPLL